MYIAMLIYTLIHYCKWLGNTSELSVPIEKHEEKRKTWDKWTVQWDRIHSQQQGYKFKYYKVTELLVPT